MQLPYFYYPDSPFTGSVTLPEDSSRHVVQVLRMKEGEKIQITNGKGHLLTAVLTLAHKKKAVANIVEHAVEPQPSYKNTIAISIIKNTNRLEWFMEKATELGISEIVPLICSRTERTSFREDRISSILVSAMLQSRQTYLPVLHSPLKYEQFVRETNTTQSKFIAHCYEANKAQFQKVCSERSSIILIGPEGDFTPEEVDYALLKGFSAVSLGHTRLRTETAAVAAAVLMCI